MKRRLSLTLATLTLVVMAAGYANAEPVSEFVAVDNAAGGTELNGFVTSDLKLTTNEDWTAAAILLTLTEGSLYNSSVGDDQSPNPAFFTVFPDLEFDTYVIGQIAGGAVDLGGSTTAILAGQTGNITWFNTTPDDTGSFPIGRFSLSDDATGAFTLRVETTGNPPLIVDGVIANGTFIPEPTTASLLAIGGFALLARTRRKQTTL